MAHLVSAVLFFVGVLSSLGFVLASASTCPNDSAFFIYNLQSQCPRLVSPSPPLEVDGNFLDRALTSKQRNTYTSVLFYASWCPFARSIRPNFETLASMFPQIEHLAMEQSSALPSIFSRYGVHRLPSILLVNETANVQYHGPKTLQSLVEFYSKTTGLKPVQTFIEDEPISLLYYEKPIMQPCVGSSLEEITKREPYLMFATLFLLLRLLLFVSPKMLYQLKAFYDSCVPHFNLEIFGETSQLFCRILHMIDLRMILTKLRLCKTRNFREGAKNCRVWASSFASVSLGKSSSSTRS